MVPQQTLYALNSDYIQDRAKALVKLAEVKNAKSDEDRARAIYRRIYSRAPSDREIGAALEFVTEAKDAAAAWAQLAHALLASNEFHFVD